MRVERLPILITAVALLAMSASLAVAVPQYSRSTNKACAACHVSVAGGPALTEAGRAFKDDHKHVPAEDVAGADFVSNKKCKMCHVSEYKSWLETPHAKSLEALKNSDPKKIAEMAERAGLQLSGPAVENEVCLSCHVTGLRLTGGFPAADSLTNVALASVTCESCHGPGSKHVAADKAAKAAAINGHPTEALCRGCHTPKMSPGFDFAKSKAKGMHAMKAAG